MGCTDGASDGRLRIHPALIDRLDHLELRAWAVETGLAGRRYEQVRGGGGGGRRAPQSRAVSARACKEVVGFLECSGAIFKFLQGDLHAALGRSGTGWHSKALAPRGP